MRMRRLSRASAAKTRSPTAESSMFTRPLAAQGRPRRSPDHNTPPADVTAPPPRAPRRSRVEYSARAALAPPSPAHRRAPRPDGTGRGLWTRPQTRPSRHAHPGPRPARGDGPGRAGGGAEHKGGPRYGRAAGWGSAAPGTGRGVPRHPDGAEWGGSAAWPAYRWSDKESAVSGRSAPARTARPGTGDAAEPSTDRRGRACPSASPPLRERESFPATRTQPAERGTAAAVFAVPAAPGCGPRREER